MGFNINMDDWGPATTLTVVAVLIVLVVGGITVITNAITFDEYIKAVIGAAISLGLLSVGRGIRMQGQPVKPKTSTRRKKTT